LFAISSVNRNLGSLVYFPDLIINSLSMCIYKCAELMQVNFLQIYWQGQQIGLFKYQSNLPGYSADRFSLPPNVNGIWKTS
jgi:hypothetical protein